MRLSPLLRVLLLCLPLLASLTLLGCGGSPAVSPASAPLPANIDGSWLLAGSLPMPGLISLATPVPVGVSLSIYAANGQLYASGHFQAPCVGGAGEVFAGASPSLTGAVAADGTFTLVSLSSNPGPTLSVQGTVPAAAGQPWSGTYTMAGTDLSGTCAVASSGMFTSTPIAPVTGTYAGTGTVRPLSVSEVSPPVASVSISMVLQQAAVFDIVSSSALARSTFGLSGTVVVQGFPCFKTGTTSATSTGYVSGGLAQLTFSMEDGSTLLYQGDLEDTGAKGFTAGSLRVRGGNCAGAYIATVSPFWDLSRQS